MNWVQTFSRTMLMETSMAISPTWLLILTMITILSMIGTMLMMTITVFGTSLKLTLMTIGITMLIKKIPTSLTVLIVSIMTMMETMPMLMKTAFSKLFGIEVFFPKASYNLHCMTSTTITMQCPMQKIGMTTTTVFLTPFKKRYQTVSGAKNNTHSTMTTTA